MNAAPEMNTSGIIAALDFEARSAQPLTQRGWQLQVCGMGPERARQTAERMLNAGMRRLLVWGTAGGLDPALQAGTLFLPDLLLDAASGTRYPVSAPLHAQLEQKLGTLKLPLVCRGTLVTTDKVLVTAKEKSRAAQQTGASMVDMESAAIAAAALGAGAEIAVLRVLLDDAGASLPPVVIRSMDTRHPHLRVAAGLLKRPQDLPAVLRLGQSFRRGYRSLNAAAELCAARDP